MYNLDGKLIRECLYLRDEHKKKLITILQDSMKDNGTTNERFNLMLRIASEIVGSGIMTRTREPRTSAGRNCIAYQMRQEGYSTVQIGKLFGRHHSSILHMVRLMEDVISYPRTFIEDEEIWNKFKAKLQEHDEKHL